MTIFRIYYEQLGGHVHMSLFAGTTLGSLGLAGTLCLREEEFADFKRLANTSFIFTDRKVDFSNPT